MYIKRHIEKTINRATEAFPAVLVTGPRQVGKSTLLKENMTSGTYVSMDDRIVMQAVRQDPRGFLKMQGIPLILDEIQRVPEIFLDIKYIIDADRRSGMYILTGSQRFELMQGISESLAGRIGIVNMLGLSMREIIGNPFDEPFFPEISHIADRKSSIDTENREIWNIIHKGGMPELYANPKMDWENYYASYVDTYIERDVRELAQVGDSGTFVQFMTALAARSGALLNMHAMAAEIGIDDKTVKRWISILEASGIIYLLKPFSLNINKRIVKTPKVYFTDTGLICYLCRWLTPDHLINGAQAGQIYETFVISEILKSYYNAGKVPNMFFFRNTAGQEVDLLFYRNHTLYPVEIKKTASPNSKDIKHFKTLHSFFPSLEIGRGGIICNYPDALPLDEKNMIIPVNVI